MNIQGKWISVFAQLYWDTQLLNVSLMGAFVNVLKVSITSTGWFLTTSYCSHYAKFLPDMVKVVH